MVIWWQIMVQNTRFWNFWKIMKNSRFEFWVRFCKKVCHGTPGEPMLFQPTPKSYFFHVVSKWQFQRYVLNDSGVVFPPLIKGRFQADFHIATSDLENSPKLYFTAKLAHFGLKMIIRPFSSKFWKKWPPFWLLGNPQTTFFYKNSSLFLFFFDADL